MEDKKQKGYSLKEKQAVIKDAVRRMEPVHTHWRLLEALYRTGAQRELTMLDLNRIIPFPIGGAFLRTVNMVLPHLSMIVNSVVSRDPKFVVTPVGGDIDTVERNALIAKNILDYFWKRTEATATLRDITQDMVILGNGFGKVGWSYSESTVSNTGNEAALEISDLVSAAQEVAQETGVPLDQNTINEIVNSVSVTQNLVEVDEPFLEYVSPYDMYLPADARRLNTARWISQKIRIPIEELKANPLFDKEAVDNLNADTGYTDPETVKQYENTDQALPAIFTHATIFEFYDMKERTITIFQLDAEKPLFEGPIPYDHRYSPFVHMRNFSDGGNTIWAFGDLENIAGIQLMINEILHAELNDLKRVGNKYFINKKILTPEVSKALQDNKADGVIPIDLPNNMNFQDVMQPVTRLSTPADNYVMEGKLQDYMQRLLGISDFQMGNAAAANRVSATASAAIEGASTTRALDKLTNVEVASKEIAIRMLALCQQFLDNSRAIRIAGPNAPTWLQVTEADIEGEFYIEIEGGSTSAINPATRKRQGQDLLVQIVPMLAQLGYDPEPTIRTALSYMGLNPDNILVKPQQAPMPPQGEASQGQTPQGELPIQAQPDQNSAILQQLLGMGGSPVPLATEGGMGQ